MTTRPDPLRLLSAARPGRLDPDGRPDPAVYTAHPRPARARRPVPRRLILTGALPVAAAATAGALVLGTGRPPAPPGAPGAAAPSGAAAPASARDLLLVAAARSDASAAPAGGRYWVRLQEHGERKEVGPPGGRYGVAVRMSVERWQASGAGDPSVEVFQYLGAAPVTPQDEAAWKAAGSPAQWTESGPAGTAPVTYGGAAGPRQVRALPERAARESLMLAGAPVTAAELAGVPTDPAALRSWLTARLQRTGGPAIEDAALFHAGRDLVAELPVPAPVRSAAYRMLADLPGVGFLGTVQDRRGRSGMAVAYTRRGDGGWGQQRLIVDPATGLALAQESWFLGAAVAPAATGTLMSWTVAVRAGYTDDPAPTA
ncbi:CU044_5270 family protein [Dactylosporangium aurantiacum]|uniref:CU044_5270 family protein n=1 Tax=Dactylosporangium aurantiacum TaxID=35754 RepID=A0A9Q9MI72_9ACTN|nr:CU044_5270 family protein [Dactylosporangium aurantiacum]MDG6103082.1 CU044_5270 family protein [Dactylosporangium aurantiacum]UWZ57594.1 CU044_5270 family protein [Dactylosporangium aurantiacum]